MSRYCPLEVLQGRHTPPVDAQNNYCIFNVYKVYLLVWEKIGCFDLCSEVKGLSANGSVGLQPCCHLHRCNMRRRHFKRVIIERFQCQQWQLWRTGRKRKQNTNYFRRASSELVTICLYVELGLSFWTWSGLTFTFVKQNLRAIFEARFFCSVTSRYFLIRRLMPTWKETR